MLLAGCAGLQLRNPIVTTPAPQPPPTFVRTTSDARMTRVFDLRPGVTKGAAFRAASDWMTQAYSVDVSDPNAGFLMTPWIADFMRDGAPDPRYRTRVIVRLLDNGTQMAVRVEANWQHGDGWDVGYDAQALEDAVSDLRARVGDTR